MKKTKIIAILCALLMITNVHAALQSRPGVSHKKKLYTTGFFTQIRDMEAAGGALGLNATFVLNSSTNEYKETSPSNNIDAHMCKNTEWGAMAMLAVSDYGAGTNTITHSYDSTTKLYGVSASSTGNMTGIFAITGTSQQTAAIAKNSQTYSIASLLAAPVRYVNIYPSGSSTNLSGRYIPGDATYEVSTFNTNIKLPSIQGTGSNTPMVSIRGNSTSGKFLVFSAIQNYTDDRGYNYTSRACVWVGEGI